MGESLIVKGNIKASATVDGKQMNISGDLSEKLHEKCDALVKDAARRAMDNGRTTVMAKDL